jgi:hypothetical protein
MGNLFVLYSALAVFGIGITLIDFLGVLDHIGHGDTGSDGADSAGADDGDSGDHDTDSDSSDSIDNSDSHHSHEHGSYLGPGDTGIRAVTGIMSALRIAVYFSLGAGPTGLFALHSGLSAGQSLLWSAAVGAGIAIFARLLRKFIRRDLDSSIGPDELMMENAVLLLPLEAGAMGKASVKQYGREREIYVRCKDQTRPLAKGSEVRIIDFDDEVYWIEPV